MILPEKFSGISLSCQTLRRSPSCPLFRRSSTCSLCHFHIPTLSDHSSSIPASEKSASHGKLHGDTLSDHNPSVGITQIRYGRRSIFLSACHTSSPVLFLLSILPLYSRKCKPYSFFLSCIRQLFKKIALRYTSNGACINTVCIQVYDQVSCRSIFQLKPKDTVFRVAGRSNHISCF